MVQSLSQQKIDFLDSESSEEKGLETIDLIALNITDKYELQANYKPEAPDRNSVGDEFFDNLEEHESIKLNGK